VLLDVILEEPRIRDRLRKLVVASSMSIYGEGKYACGEHGAVYPRLRPAAQMAAHEWECRCPQCGRAVNPELTDEAKPLEPTSIYAISKKDQEEMCMAVGQAYGIPTVALRYFNTYGSRQALGNPYTGVVALFSSRLLNGRSPVVYEDGCQTRDFVHVSDVVRANLLIMAAEKANFGVFNVGTGRPVAIREVGELLARRLESDRRPQVVEQFRAGDIRHCVADIGRLERLGYRPEVTLEEGMDEVLRWVGSQQAEDRFDEAQRELLARGLAR
jgi:dTDP-L-rhamnose 4-epimerase